MTGLSYHNIHAFFMMSFCYLGRILTAVPVVNWYKLDINIKEIIYSLEKKNYDYSQLNHLNGIYTAFSTIFKVSAMYIGNFFKTKKTYASNSSTE